MQTNQNPAAFPAEDPDTRTIRLGGREITQRWDGICWMTVSDRKASK